MFASHTLMRKLVLVLAVVAGISPRAAVSADCKMSVQATPQVIYSGQNADVDVFAHFATPPAPGGAYAFASSTFDVIASDPMWTLVSAGVIVGNDVLGINVGQVHQPYLGNYADPSNPLRVWNGKFEPQSDKPALIGIAVDPNTFSVYPSKYTSTSVECDAAGGSDFLFVNPVNVGRWGAAPGKGTEMRVHDDVIVDGRIITGENWDSVSVGIVPTGTVTFFDSSTHVSVFGESVTFAATVQAQEDGHAQRSMVTSLTVTFSALEGGGHAGGANFSMADGSVRFVRYDAFRGGVFVASGDFNGDGGGKSPGFVVESIPDTFDASSGPGVYRSTDSGLTWTLHYDEPVGAIIRGANGQQQKVMIDEIRVRGIGENAAEAGLQSGMKPISLGCHVFKAQGAQGMSIAPKQ